MPVPSIDGNPIVALYRRRVTEMRQGQAQSARRANQVSYGRGVTFLAAVACFLLGWFGQSGRTVWFVAGGAWTAGFFWLVWLHGRVLTEVTRRRQLSRINRQAEARTLREWDQIPLRATETPPDSDALANDLDLFGNASLFHLVCVAKTPLGINTLRDWFLQPADSASVVQRQQAVAELAAALESRQELELAGLAVLHHRMDPSQLLQWAEAEPWLAQRRWLIWASRSLPVLMLVFLVLSMIGLLPPSLITLPLMASVAIGMIYRRRMHAIFDFISTRQGEVAHYANLFRLIATTRVTSTLLLQLQQQVAANGVEACREIHRLGRRADMANLRFSDMSHFLVQSLLSWDFHVLALLERWQLRNGRYVRQWFDGLGQWEALASLAALSHDNPGWALPVVDNPLGGQPAVRARSLGHPLIAADRRVANDVTIGPPATILMVTGSNMSGKSTLLRAVGTNVVLAQAGAPVCAEQFSMPPVVLATSMRIHDSLADGVSFYLAELRRLKQIVDNARHQRTDTSRILLYLLDEILQGTNTAERQIAVRRVLSHLLTHGAIGAVSTHDLQLAAAPSLASASRPVHFRETIHNEGGHHTMTFDYILREGPATTSNALKLLDMVGLNDA